MASQAVTSQATVLARTVCSIESNLEAVTVQQQACADRSTKLCIAGIDVEGVSVAGQVWHERQRLLKTMTICTLSPKDALSAQWGYIPP